MKQRYLLSKKAEVEEGESNLAIPCPWNGYIKKCTHEKMSHLKSMREVLGTTDMLGIIVVFGHIARTLGYLRWIELRSPRTLVFWPL